MVKDIDKSKIENLIIEELGKSDLKHNVQRAKHIYEKLGYKGMQHYIGFASKIRKYSRTKSKNFFKDFDIYFEDILTYYNNDSKAIIRLIQSYNHQSQYSIKLDQNNMLVEEKDENNKSYKLDI